MTSDGSFASRVGSPVRRTCGRDFDRALGNLGPRPFPTTLSAWPRPEPHTHQDGIVSAPARTGVVVAIDGTSGSGKSSTSRGVASRLGLRYLDTGAMYRAMTWWMLRNDVP